MNRTRYQHHGSVNGFKIVGRSRTHDIELPAIPDNRMEMLQERNRLFWSQPNFGNMGKHVPPEGIDAHFAELQRLSGEVDVQINLDLPRHDGRLAEAGASTLTLEQIAEINRQFWANGGRA